jgi:uncharacterized protein
MTHTDARHPAAPARGRFLLAGAVALLALVIASASAQEFEVPRLTARVTDLANVLSAEERADLEAILKVHEDSTSNQIAVLVVPTTGEEPIENYAVRAFEVNAIGTKAHDNGVLLLVATDDRRIRIEVGYGLEGAVTDAISALIIENAIKPRFRDGDYYGGIKAGVEDIMKAAAGEYKAEPGTGEDVPGGISFGTIVFMIIVLWFIGRMFRGGGRGGRGGGLGGLLPWIIMSRGGRGWGGGGGFGGGGFGGGGFGGGGGWSGGGGSSGGGGASGSW